MNTPTTFLYYAAETNEWQKTTLEELATLNDPDLYIIPIHEGGDRGQQTTWAEYNSPEYQKAQQQAARQAEESKKHQQILQQIAAQKKADQEKEQRRHEQAQQHQHLNLQAIKEELTTADIKLTCQLLRYVCRLFCVLFWLNLFGGCITVGFFSGGSAGVVIGLILAGIIWFIISEIISKWEAVTAKSPNTHQPGRE